MKGLNPVPRLTISLSIFLISVPSDGVTLYPLSDIVCSVILEADF